MTGKRDHGGGIDDAVHQFGGARANWLDLSTGINPSPYPTDAITQSDWCELPDKGAFSRLETAARSFWNIPDAAAVMATPGASSPIAMIPHILSAGTVNIARATYNEHAAAFSGAGWEIVQGGADAHVVVHPNNPDGSLFSPDDPTKRLLVIDESFCDVCPENSHIIRSVDKNTLVLKSFGKFWGLAGLRLGMVIGDPVLINALRQRIGPWQVSGPALSVGTAALNDLAWAKKTRERLKTDAEILDQMMNDAGHATVGGTTLFRLYEVENAQDLQITLANHHIWTRIFPYSKNWIRLGLPGCATDWARLAKALKT